jgi:glycosyltransferase involved in cell wall biosynthesis
LTILHLDTERGWRGGQRQVLWLAQALDSGRYRSLIAARPGEPLAIRAAAAGLSVVPSQPFGELDIAAAIHLRRVLLRERVSIVHAHTAHAVALAAMATLASDARVVVTRRVDFRLRPNLATRWKYDRADAVIAISEAVAAALVASGIPRSRITVIPSGIDLTRQIAPASPHVLAALGVPAGAPLVVQVAQLVPHKDPVTFVEAIAVARTRVPALHALIVGDGPLRAAVVAAVDRLHLADAVHVVGYRTDADNLLAAADVVTLSSREEGLGTTLLDALALGKLIAAPAAGGIAEIITPDCGRLVPIADPGALGQAVADLLVVGRDDPRRQTEIATAARRRAAEFSIGRTAERTAAVYEAVRTDSAPR